MSSIVRGFCEIVEVRFPGVTLRNLARSSIVVAHDNPRTVREQVGDCRGGTSVQAAAARWGDHREGSWPVVWSGTASVVTTWNRFVCL